MGSLPESASPAEVNLVERPLARVSAPRRGQRLIHDKPADALLLLRGKVSLDDPVQH